MTQIISEKQFDYPPYVETIPESTACAEFPAPGLYQP